MKIKKLLFIVILVMMLIMGANFTYAATPSQISTDNFEPSGLTTNDYQAAFNMTSTIVSTITILGTVIAVIMVIALGIKYICGSVEEKAEYKKSMMPLLVGAILIFGSSTLVSIVYSIVDGL